MIQIYPDVEQKFTCPICNNKTEVIKKVWQGIHVGVESECKKCQKTFHQDLKVGHSISKLCSVDLNNFDFFCAEDPKEWYAKPLRDSLKYPNNKQIEFRKEIYTDHDKVILLNCIDYLYGHSLLKLLNAERHLKDNPDLGLIVIVPKFLEWMVPNGIAEKWVFDISLKEGQEYFIEFNNAIQKEIERFSQVYVSKAFSHPNNFNITNFTGVEKHNFQKDDFRITFIWREDRLWINNSFLQNAVNKLSIRIFKNILLTKQKRKILKVFSEMRKIIPDAKYTVVGVGEYKKFPNWIDNQIVNNFDAKIEKKLCQIYSESRAVVGIHGSNMLLPSAHAGMTIDLMPDDRWGNFAQDILYQENDARMSSYRYRYVPINQKANFLNKMIVYMIQNRDGFVENMAINK